MTSFSSNVTSFSTFNRDMRTDISVGGAGLYEKETMEDAFKRLTIECGLDLQNVVDQVLGSQCVKVMADDCVHLLSTFSIIPRATA